jgi:hypothetical protein
MTSRQWGRGSKDRWYFVVGKSHTHTVAYLVIFFYSILDLPVFKYRHIIFSTFYSSGLLDFACGRWPLKFIFFLHPEDARLSSTQWDMTSKNHTSCVLVRIPDSQSTWLLSYMDMVIYIFFRWKKKEEKRKNTRLWGVMWLTQGHIPTGSCVWISCPRSEVLNLWAVMPLANLSISKDIYITIHNSSKIAVMK